MSRFSRAALFLTFGVISFFAVSVSNVKKYTHKKIDYGTESGNILQSKMTEDALLTAFNKSYREQNCSLVASGQREKLSSNTGLFRSVYENGFLSGINELTNNSLFAACEFVYTPHSPHFAHAFAQFYRCFSWWNANPEKKPVLLYDRSLNGGDRHSTKFESGFLKALEDVFGVFIARNFSAPAVRIGRGNFGMLGSADSRRLRSGILDFYNLSNPSREANGENMAVIGVLNRLHTRSIRNPDDIYLELSKRSKNFSPFRVRQVQYFESKSFLEQVEYFSSTDIILTVHGAQITGIPFMPPCGAVVEIMPKDYVVPWYFGELAAASEIGYSFFSLLNHSESLNLTGVSEGYHTRSRLRAQNFCISFENIVEGLMEIHKEWKECKSQLMESYR